MQAILMCRLLGLEFELRTPNGLIGADAETKQAAFLRLNPLGQARRARRHKLPGTPRWAARAKRGAAPRSTRA
jgi:hypothetical protein